MVKTLEELKLERERQMQRERQKQYRLRNEIKGFSANLSKEKYELLETKLKEKGITKKQFLEDAIDKFLKE